MKVLLKLERSRAQFSHLGGFTYAKHLELLFDYVLVYKCIHFKLLVNTTPTVGLEIEYYSTSGAEYNK